MFSRFLNSKTKTVTFAASILAVSALFSQLLAIFRNNLLATSFPNEQTDVYFAAFRVPDFVYGILITGGIVAAFLPVFSAYFKRDKGEARDLTNNVLFIFLVALSGLSFILAVLAPYLTRLVVPGFTVEQKALTVALMRIMFLSPILLGVSAIFSGVLQYFNLFFAYALAPIFYNLGIICGILLFYPFMGLKGLAWGVILGAFLHLLVQLPSVLKCGFRPRFTFNLKHSGLKRIFKLMLPRTVGAAAYHINLVIITAIASTVSAGAISIFNYSNYLYGVPISLIGIAFATAVFPVLSKNFAGKQRGEFLKNFSSTFSQILFFIIPLSLLIFVLRAQLVRLLYGTSLVGNGYFGWWETRLTAAAVGIFAVSLFAACLIPFLARVFFSLQNTKTPVKIAVSTVALNIVLSYFFVWSLGFPNIFQKTLSGFLKLQGIENMSVIGLPLALTISSIFQFLLLTVFLKRRIAGVALTLHQGTGIFLSLFRSFLKVLLAAILMAVAVWLSLRAWVLFLDTYTVVGVLSQLVLASLVGILVFFLTTRLLGSKEPKIICSAIKAQFRK